VQDVSRVTGDPVLLTIDGKDYLLRGMTFEDLGVVQGQLVKEKRQRIIDAAADMVKALGDSVPWPDRRAILDDARKEASRVGFISDDELWGYLQTNDGAVLMLWTCFERQHPGAFTRAGLMKLMASGKLSKQDIERLLIELVGGSEGNLTGQVSGAAQPAATAPPATTPS
jgi:hypothetical protein